MTLAEHCMQSVVHEVSIQAAVVIFGGWHHMVKVPYHYTTTESANRCTVKAAYPQSFQASIMCQFVKEKDFLFLCWPAIEMFSIDTINNHMRYYRFHSS